VKRKPKTIARLLDDCAVVLQKIVRMKAAIHAKSPQIQCVTCSKKRHWKEMHGGHYIARTWTAHKILEDNIHPQCPGCNTFKPERMADDYHWYMVDTYGVDWVQHLNQTKREVVKRTRAELEEELARLKAQCKQLEAEVPV
jgi:hypothetical protein